jgi:Fe-S-cluster-containing dehydrogenase component
MDRIDEGLEPACVTKCVTHCLHFGKADEPETSRRERFAQSIAMGMANSGAK